MFEVNIKDVGTAQRLLASAIDNWNSVPMLSMALATAAPGEDFVVAYERARLSSLGMLSLAATE